MRTRTIWVFTLLFALVALAACGGGAAPEAAPAEEAAAPAAEEPPAAEEEAAPAAEEPPPAQEEAPAPTEEAAPAPAPAETEGECVRVAIDSTPIRLLPDQTGESLGFAAQGDVLQVERLDNVEWYKLVPPPGFQQFPDLWIWNGATESASCSELPQPAAPATVEVPDCVKVSLDSTPIRQLPESTGQALGFASLGQVLDVDRLDNVEWYKIVPPAELAQFPDLWIWSGAGESVSCSELPQPGQATETVVVPECVTVTLDSTPIRLLPDSAGESLGFAKAGDVLQVQSLDNQEWYKIAPPAGFEQFPDLWIWTGASESATCP